MITKLGKEMVQADTDVPIFAQAGAVLAAMPAARISRRLIQKPLAEFACQEALQPGLTPSEGDRLFKDMVGNRKIIFEEAPSPMTSYYDPKARKVVSSKTSYILAHELGHATGPLGLNSNIGSLLTKTINKLRKPRFTALTEAINSARDAWRRKKGLPEEDGINITQSATNIGRLASALNLVEEAQASLRGIAAINKIKGKAGVVGAAKILGPAFGTYVAPEVGSHVIAPWVGGMIGSFAAS